LVYFLASNPKVAQVYRQMSQAEPVVRFAEELIYALFIPLQIFDSIHHFQGLLYEASLQCPE